MEETSRHSDQEQDLIYALDIGLSLIHIWMGNIMTQREIWWIRMATGSTARETSSIP